MSLPELFKNYLRIQGASSITTRNYLVDINHFLNWLAQKTGIKYQIVGKAIFGLFTKETINEYKTDLLRGKIPFSSINRHLSALRKFGQFGQNQGWLNENPAEKVANVQAGEVGSRSVGQREEILQGFQKQLEKEKVSPITTKNYLSDLKHFLGWLETS